MMKRVVFLVISSVLIAFVSCNTEKVEGDDRPAYVYTQDIVNPPDDFLILFNNLSVGQKVAKVTFSDSLVWQIERIGDGRQTVSMKNDTGYYYVNLTDTVGLAGGFTYEINVNSFLYGESNTVFVGFRRTNKDYLTFEPKF